MTLTELRYIVAVAREKHFGHAAESCHVSQPTLSIAVRKLEDELGVTLFERRHGNISVTPAGVPVIEQAQRVLEEAALLHELAAQGRDELNGPLRIGLIHTVGPYVLPQLVPTLHERAPSMPLVIEEGYTVTLTQRLRAGELDVIVISEPFEEAGLSTRALYDEPFVVLLPASHPLVANERIRPGQLADEQVLMLGAGHCFRDQVLAACPECTQHGGERDLLLDGSSLETIRHMVASGIGLTVLPCTAAGADRYAQRLLAIRRFEEPVPKRRVSLAWRRSFPRPSAIDAVEAAFTDCRFSGVTLVESN